MQNNSELKDLSVESQTLTAADGGRTRLDTVRRRGGSPSEGAPIVLLHGMFTDRRFWLSDRGIGLGGFLARRGHTVYILQRRAITDGPPAGGRPGMNEHVRFDLPALEALIGQSTQQPIFYVGHSFGSYTAARAAGYSLTPARVGGLVFLAGQFDYKKGMITPPGIWLTRIGLKLFGKLPARLAGLGPADEPPAVAYDAMAWIREGRKTERVKEVMARISAPVLGICGVKDQIDPVEGCRRFVSYVGSTDQTFLIASRADGFAKDYDHAGIVIDRAARADVWPRVAEWVEARPSRR